jgi:hypothetical protein
MNHKKCLKVSLIVVYTPTRLKRILASSASQNIASCDGSAGIGWRGSEKILEEFMHCVLSLPSLAAELGSLSLFNLAASFSSTLRNEAKESTSGISPPRLKLNV